MRAVPRLHHLLLGLLVVTPSQAAMRQQQPIRVRTEVVLVDFIAVDQKGRFVTDLRPEEITLFEDGKAQELQFFEYMGRYLQGAPSDGFFRPESDRKEPTPTPAVPRARATPLIIIVDLDSMSPPGLTFAKNSILEVMRRNPGPERMMLTVLRDGLRKVYPFTTSAERMAEYLQEVHATKSPPGYDTYIDRIAAIYQRNRSCPDCDPLSEAINTSRSFLFDLANRIQSTSQAMATIALQLQEIPGRKQALFYSYGYPLRSYTQVLEILTQYAPLHPRSLARLVSRRGDSARAILGAKLAGVHGSGSGETLRKAIEQLNGAQTSVYSIDPRGLEPGMIAQSGPNLLLRNTGVMANLNQQIAASQEFLRNASYDTGGVPYLNRNDLDQGLEYARDDARNYYLAGFVPGEEEESAPSRIKIETSRPDVRLRYRTMYFPNQSETSDPVSTAFRFPGFYEDFPMKVKITTPENQLHLTVEVPTEVLSFQLAAEKHICTLELYAALLDASGTWLEGQFAVNRRFKLELDRDQLKALREKEKVLLPATTEIDSGSYDLVVAVRQLPSGNLSTFRTRLEVR